jgi:hypothetical protein
VAPPPWPWQALAGNQASLVSPPRQTCPGAAVVSGRCGGRVQEHSSSSSNSAAKVAGI